MSETPYPGDIRLQVDLRQAPRRVLAIRETIPVASGPLALHYPQWIPGEHAPSGPISGVTGLRIRAGGNELRWRRDRFDLFTLELEVPSGVDTLELEFQFLPPSGGGSFGQAVSATPNLAVLAWNQVVFYPAGYRARDIRFKPSVWLPAGWSFGCALERDGEREGGDEQHFVPTALDQLVDSPLLAGVHYRRLVLDDDVAAPVNLHIVADAERHLKWKDAQIEGHRALITQAKALFGARHYAHYDFLLTLSDLTAHFGLEHAQSSDNRLEAEFFTDDGSWLTGAGLLPHEFVHSWNGKFRVPEGSATPHYNLPMNDELMWVYEGLTTYWGDVLTTRSDLWTPEQYRDALATDAALVAQRPGGAWRSLQDTCDDASQLYDAPGEWSNWRRSVDFYLEGALLWLAVDARLRVLSDDRRSLDDFARSFHGAGAGEHRPRSYTEADIVVALEAVQPGDWGPWLRRRLDATRDRDPLDGLRASGWWLAFSDQPSDYFKHLETRRKVASLAYSMGATVGKEDGKLHDVVWQSPAFAAGLAPGMKLVAVNGEKFSADALKAAIATSAKQPATIDLLVQNLDHYRNHELTVSGGLRYPKLDRDEARADRLAGIIAAR